jgi:hypothetical protein
MSANIYYVYQYVRSDGTPYYIGKGTGRRAWGKHSNISIPKDKSKIVIVKDMLTEKEAHELEKSLISEYGRKDLGTGILRNLTDGGEGKSGWIAPEEFKQKKREISNTEEAKDRARKWGSLAKLTEEGRNKIIESLKGNQRAKGMTYSHSIEAKYKIGEFHRNKIVTKETKEKMSRNRKGKALGNNNAMSSLENRKKVAESKIGRKRIYREDGSWYFGYPDDINNSRAN